jgi:16S rRNA (guanine966-N2)-methyltransferase
VRVIAGTARGRALRLPPDADLRPTSDLVKGAIFSLLEAEAYKRGFEPDDDALAAARAWPRVLDLYAGSGALGIEALSRGAAHADFVDASRTAVGAIQANLAAAGFADRATVHRQPVAAALARLAGPFDLVFADPPYAATDQLPGLVQAVEKRSLLLPTSVVVLEHAASVGPPAAIGGLALAKSRRHGKTRVSVYWARPRNAVDSTEEC